MVPKFLVPDNTTLAASASVEERFVDGPTQRARIFVRESTRGGPAPRKTLFAEAMLENSATKPRRRLGDFVVSATVQLLLLVTLLLLPLYFTQAIDVHLFNKTLLVVPPPAPAPPPARALARSVASKPRVISVVGKLVMPRAIPHQVARLTEQSEGNDAAAAIVPGEGVPGGIPGGQPGGGIGGVLSGAAPPAPIDSAPKGPIRVGGGVKAPRLVFWPEPVYPVLARHPRAAGARVIDAATVTDGHAV